MKNISGWVGILALGLVSVAAYADCPNFSGSYLHKLSDSSRETLKIEQTDCTFMHVVSAMDDADHPEHNHSFEDDWSLDGVPQSSPQFPPAMRFTRQFDGQVLVTECKMISLTGVVHFVTRSTLTPEGNISNEITTYGLTGSVSGVTHEDFIRQ